LNEGSLSAVRVKGGSRTPGPEEKKDSVADDCKSWRGIEHALEADVMETEKERQRR
jgi:hypothetical protein